MGWCTDSFSACHEIISGIAGFVLLPDYAGQAVAAIWDFISKVMDNLEDVLSQRERLESPGGAGILAGGGKPIRSLKTL